jgi:anti-sigma B factor antagonist
MMDFQITVEQLDTASIVSLSGEVDLYAAPEFKQRLLELIEAGAALVVVDLSKTTFIDSTTLGVLMGALSRLRQQEGDLSLVCRDQNMIRVFEITGLDRVFSIYSTRVEAVKQFDLSGAPA